MERAKDIAARMKLDSFKASKKWISAFKHRHHIHVQVLHGEAASADGVGVNVARAMIPELLWQHGADPHDVAGGRWSCCHEKLNYCV